MTGLRLETLRGAWALVTGASSGIGREFARQLAAAGVNLVLVARRAQALSDLATDLEVQHGVRVVALPTDLAQPGAPEVLRARLRQAGIRLRLLVNNAALGHWGDFSAEGKAHYEAMLRVNTWAPLALCLAFEQDLTQAPGGAVINVASPAAYQPVPHLAVYAASKAFLYSFSLALHQEWGGRGVLVQTLLPGPTDTDLPGARAGGVGRLVAAAETVGASLAGLRRGAAIVTTARGTLLQRVFALLPARLVLPQVARLFRARPG